MFSCNTVVTAGYYNSHVSIVHVLRVSIYVYAVLTALTGSVDAEGKSHAIASLLLKRRRVYEIYHQLSWLIKLFCAWGCVLDLNFHS